MRMKWLVIGLVAIEILGVAGLVAVLNGGVNQIAPIAVCLALVVVPVLFGIALHSELRRPDK